MKRHDKLIIILYVIIAIFFLTKEGKSAPSKEYINNKIIQAATEQGVDPLLLKALCQAESSSRLRPDSFNFEDGGEGNHSFGICQILYSTAKGLGFKDPRCVINFDTATTSEINRLGGVIEKPIRKIYKNCKLFGPYTNATQAAKYLKKQLKRYKGNVNKAVSAYNLGSYKKCITGYLTLKFVDSKTGKVKKYKKKCTVGGPLNEYYVNKVKNNLRRLKNVDY